MCVCVWCTYKHDAYYCAPACLPLTSLSHEPTHPSSLLPTYPLFHTLAPPRSLLVSLFQFHLTPLSMPPSPLSAPPLSPISPPPTLAHTHRSTTNTGSSRSKSALLSLDHRRCDAGVGTHHPCPACHFWRKIDRRRCGRGDGGCDT